MPEPETAAPSGHTVIARFASAERCGKVVDDMWRTHPSSAFVVRQDPRTEEWLVVAGPPNA